MESTKYATQYVVNGEETGLWYVTAGEYADNFTITINDGQNYQYYDVAWQTVLQQIYELGFKDQALRSTWQPVRLRFQPQKI